MAFQIKNILIVTCSYILYNMTKKGNTVFLRSTYRVALDIFVLEKCGVFKSCNLLLAPAVAKWCKAPILAFQSHAIADSVPTPVGIFFSASLWALVLICIYVYERQELQKTSKVAVERPVQNPLFGQSRYILIVCT